MSVLLEALRLHQPLPKSLGLFGTVLQHRMPCPSSNDPGANDYDDEESGMLACIEEAESFLAQARKLIESRKPGALLAAQSRMTEAAGWLVAE